jgi:hypothetical protein
MASSFWPRWALFLAVVLVTAAAPRPSRAAGDSSGPAAGAPSAAGLQGLAVVAFPGATEAAWPLAQALYAEPSVRPSGIDDASARVLCGEAAPNGSAAPLVDLAAAVAALRGEDAPSRILLADIARRAAVRALVTVRLADGHPLARVFLVETGSFDAATFAPDDAPPRVWSAAVKSLVRSYAVRTPEPSTPPVRPAPALATHETPRSAPAPSSRAFYESAWFWGALGGAALAGGLVFLATRDTSPSTIHLELQVH